ncbi:MAG: delta-60 repeat domain-containing protein [Blastocatellia bacterium]
MNRYRKLNYALFHRRQIGLAVFVAMLALAAYPAWHTLAAGGNLDTSFSVDGRYALPWVPPYTQYEYQRHVEALLIQPNPNNVLDERVITAYSTDLVRNEPIENKHFELIRLTSSGAKDSTFGNNGSAVVNFASTGLPPSNGTVKALALQSNGKILVAGNLDNGSNNTNIVGLARLTVDGDLDTSFSDDGLWFFFGISEVFDMIVQTDGKILLAGRMKTGAGTYWKSALWRFNSNGTPDSSFGTNGYLHTTVWTGSSTDGGEREGFKSVYQQADGKIVALNNPDDLYKDSDDINGYGYRLRRFTASGAVDSTLQVNASTGDRGNSIRPVGSNIWVVGSSGEYGAIFARNSTNGLLDTSFGNNGKVVSSQPSVWSDINSRPFSFPTKYVIVGWNKAEGFQLWQKPAKAVITRYSATGLLDTSFGTNGSTETTGFYLSMFGTFPDSRYYSVGVGLSGKIVAGGSGYSGGVLVGSGAVARYWGN